MATKRADGEGTIFQRKDGTWVGRISFGTDPETGKRLQKTVYGRTQKQVREKLEDLKLQKRHHARSVVAKDSLESYLQTWLQTVQRDKAGKTYVEYELAARLYINPYIGHVVLTKLDGRRLEEWQNTLHRDGFTANQRKRSIRVLRNALNKAVRLKAIAVNPCLSISIPRVANKEVVPLEPEQCHRLFEVCSAHRLGDLIILATMTGMRKGELFALEWSDVNLAEGVLSVRHTVEEVSGALRIKDPKTGSSRRAIMLGPIELEALRRRLQKAEDEGMPPEAVPIVFPNIRGGYLRSSNFDRSIWHPIRDSAGISKSFTLHDLRHTQASLMVAAGNDFKTIQQRLGHSRASTTMDIYSHLMQGAQAEAVDRVAAFMAAKKPRNESQ